MRLSFVDPREVPEVQDKYQRCLTLDLSTRIQVCVSLTGFKLKEILKVILCHSNCSIGGFPVERYTHAKLWQKNDRSMSEREGV